MSVKKCGCQTAYHDHVHQANQYCAKEDDGLTEGAYCSCTAGYEIYACFFKFSIVSAVPIQANLIVFQHVICQCYITMG
jgi:hypothetical protein